MGAVFIARVSGSNISDLTAPCVPQHPHIVNCYGTLTAISPLAPSGSEVQMIVMYSHQTTLWNFLAEQSRKDEQTRSIIGVDHMIASGGRQQSSIDLSVRLGIAQGIASGMSMLHSHGVVHLDLKSQNILMEGHKPMIADMGSAQTEVQLRSGYYTPGSGPWMAPEILRGVLKLPADVYSFGMILWELLVLENLLRGWEQGHPQYPQHPPFFGEDGPVWARKGYRPTIPPHVEEHYSNWVSLIRDCWQLEPDRRPTFTTIRERCGQPELEAQDVSAERPAPVRAASEMEMSAVFGSAVVDEPHLQPEPAPEDADEEEGGTVAAASSRYLRDSVTPVVAWFQAAGLERYGAVAAQDEAYCQYGLSREEGFDALETLLREEQGFADCVQALGMTEADAQRLMTVVSERAPS